MNPDRISDGTENLLDELANIKELNEISSFMQDEELDNALIHVVRIMAKPDINPTAASKLIVKFSAQCVDFRMKAKYYMLIGKSEENASQKKNIYMTVADALQELVNSMKYTTRV